MVNKITLGYGTIIVDFTKEYMMSIVVNKIIVIITLIRQIDHP